MNAEEFLKDMYPDVSSEGFTRRVPEFSFKDMVDFAEEYYEHRKYFNSDEFLPPYDSSGDPLFPTTITVLSDSGQKVHFDYSVEHWVPLDPGQGEYVEVTRWRYPDPETPE